MATYKYVNADQLDAKLGTVGDAIREKGKTMEMLSFPDGMVSAIEAISTGVELNFDIVAYSTEAALLAATPKENTIGIIPQIPMNGWGFYATEPAEPVQGMVWITVGTSSTVEFNALKKNTVMVYPVSANQYVDGAWVNVIAMSYQNGAWNEFSSLEVYVYNLGWTGTASGFDHYYVSRGGSDTSSDRLPITVTYLDGYIVMNRKGFDGRACVYTDKDIDLTNVDTIFCKTGSIGSGSGGESGAIYFGVGKASSINATAKVQLIASETVYALDVSSLSGEYRIGFYGPTVDGADWSWDNRKIESFWYA